MNNFTVLIGKTKSMTQQPVTVKEEKYISFGKNGGGGLCNF